MLKGSRRQGLIVGRPEGGIAELSSDVNELSEIMGIKGEKNEKSL